MGPEFSLLMHRSDTGRLITSDVKVAVNSTGTVVGFSLVIFPPSFLPYNISIVSSGDGKYMASTQFLRLPDRTDGGSVTKIDNLHGALLVNTTESSWKNSVWKPLFPYSFYLNGDWLIENPNNMATFRDYGYNVLHIVPAGGLGYNFTQLDQWLDEAQRVGLWIMYDMRWTYQNSSLVEWQVNRLKVRQSLLLWYTADEPDGQVDPLDSPKRAYDLIKSLDPYHPVSLCLNCENYYFEEYAAGADIILSDVYPIGTNTSWSTIYETACNTTYGCCGCDNCVGYNNLSNVPARLDTFREYQTQLGLPQKPLWGTPQAFGNSEFWKQTPTWQEEIVMNMLSINHGAKGIIMWTFPTTPELTNWTNELAQRLTDPLASFILGAEMVSGLTVIGAPIVDASAWIHGDWMLLSIVNPSHEDTVGPVVLELPAGFMTSGFTIPAWGPVRGWRPPTDKSGGFKQLVRMGLPGLNVDIFFLLRERAPVSGSGSRSDIVKPPFAGF
ncbi:hypothetical protein OEA41_009085 [Lepraria neglecta]|uniref:Uncharacterized protein n=1 Tax=Lepraria neglecta TaxID=209136 RepID=A0AAD9Z2J6_9LECA|nr:hypothetical protein OEA41_009085 [Lepraria neglecta]